MELQPLSNQSLPIQSMQRMEVDLFLFRFQLRSFHLSSHILKPISSLVKDYPSLSLPISPKSLLSPLSQDHFLLVYHSIHQQESYLELLYLPFLSQTSPFKHPIKLDQLNSQSPFKSLFLYPIFIILNSHSLSSKDNHSQSLQSFQETILYSQSLQELFLLVYLSINQLESFLVFLHLHSHLHLSLFRLPINSDSFKLNYPLLLTLYPLSLSFSSLLLFLSFSLFLSSSFSSFYQRRRNILYQRSQ